jgi:hypothetical protein
VCESVTLAALMFAHGRDRYCRATKPASAGWWCWVTFGEQSRVISPERRSFASDVVSYSDGGGLVRAAGKPITGRERVAKFISAVAAHFWRGVTVSVVEANGQRCALISRDGVVVALVTVGASDEGIDQIMWMLRPSKLAGVLPPLP